MIQWFMTHKKRIQKTQLLIESGFVNFVYMRWGLVDANMHRMSYSPGKQIKLNQSKNIR